MRRVLALVQLLLLVLPCFAMAAALHTGSDSNLPACCRRSGTHHCMVGMQMGGVEGMSDGVKATAVGHPCPFCPKAMPAAQHAPLAPAPSAAAFAQIISHPACFAQTQARFRLARDRSRQKRGPPTLA